MDEEDESEEAEEGVDEEEDESEEANLVAALDRWMAIWMAGCRARERRSNVRSVVKRGGGTSCW